MAKVLVLYYSSFGHIETMARAVAEGAMEAQAEVEIMRVSETVPENIAKSSGFKVNLSHSEATPDDLVTFDAIIFGTPTNYGNISAQMSAFWSRTTGLWKKAAYVGKIGGAFSSTGSQHGGNEASILSMHKTLLHHGFIIVGLPYSFQGQLETDRAIGGSPYGATTIAGRDLSKQPSVVDLEGAKFQGKHTAKIATRLFGQ
jgi:NAD(P)H dehydrogenase (quinone)